MATDPRRLLAPQFNTGIVPVQRSQPYVNDGGEAARLAAARVNQMPPPTFDRTQIVPVAQQTMPVYQPAPRIDIEDRIAQAQTIAGQHRSVDMPFVQPQVRDRDFPGDLNNLPRGPLPSGPWPQRIDDIRARVDAMKADLAMRRDERMAQRDLRRSAREQAQAARQAQFEARRTSRSQRIAEIMANRPSQGVNNGLLGQGFAPGGDFTMQPYPQPYPPFPRRG